MATCEDLGLKVLQQNPQARSEWGRLAREGHDVWQVLDHGRYLGVIVDGVPLLPGDRPRAPRHVNTAHIHLGPSHARKAPEPACISTRKRCAVASSTWGNRSSGVTRAKSP